VGIFKKLFKEKGQLIHEEVRDKFRTVSMRGPGGLFKYHTGKEGLEKLGYPREVISILPEDVKGFFCGVGNPIIEAGLSGGKRILDVGSGAGVDAIVAAHVSGPDSEVTGVDMLQEMVDLAGKNAEKTGVRNVSFIQTPGGDLPFPDGHFDILISNGVFNLIVDKEEAISEWFRVLSSGGEAVIADMSLEDGVTKEDVKGKGAWSD